jgi:hypothetical protein
VIGAGTFINPLIKIITVVAILAAVYFFFVKPTLDTTEDITNSVGGSIAKSQREFKRELQQADVPDGQFSYSFSGGDSAKDIQKATECISKANNDAVQIQECVDKVTK